MKNQIRLSLALALISCITNAQSKVQKYIADQSNQHRWLNEYAQFLSIPNVLGDSVNIARNANHISNMLNQLGVKSELLFSGKPGSAPVVFGSVSVPGATNTIAFYAHYDGQPVNPKQWAEGLQPFVPVLLSDRLDKGGIKISFPKDQEKINSAWRLYSRGSSDDKAGVFSIITAYETLLKTGLKPTVNIKFFFEGEEEAGSINLAEIFSKYKDKLGANLWVICDGPRHISGKKQVLFGVRGDVNLDLKVYASKRPLHSGNYGNWAPNPAMRLAQLLSSMKDNNGNVLIEGFYDDVVPLSEKEKATLAKIPKVESMLQEDLALGQPDGNGKSFMELLQLPTLNINGMQSGNVGSMATNVIPTEATAVLDLRLVLGNDIDRQINKVTKHIIKQGYQVIDHEPSDAERRQYPLLAKVVKRKGGYNAQRTPMDLPLAQKVCTAVETTIDYEVIKVPSLGGSLPLFLFEQKLGAKPITVPVVNYDNNQHAENENVILQYLWNGIETMAAIMSMK
ncbi:MAG: M20/M25/M40 family metallo-hydrolase [Bacteroidetes bacterium]|nr:M20/M25/M40 family metallo-hydrolase [Bacteroidota bacterium]MBI3483056.1 M20/M25/M40 family metallo-hydrolase [Bacteroidota bacterium]